VVDCTPRRNEATSFADVRALHLVVHAVVRAHPACLAGAHVCVGIAGPHIRSSALSASEEASSPARYRALRIRFDPPSNPPPVGGTRSSVPVSRLSHPFRGGGPRSASSRADGRRRRGIALLARWLIRGRETELGSVKPHAMHDHGELARHRHERALMTAFGRKAQAPRLHGAVLLRSRHHRVGGLIKRAVRTSPSPRREMCSS